MNLDDLLKSIRDEDDDDSKGGKDLDDLIDSIRQENAETEKNLDNLLDSIKKESKGAKIDNKKFLNVKTFTNPLMGQRYQAPGLPSAPPIVIKPNVIKINPEKLVPQDESATDVKVEPDKLIPEDESENEEIIEKLNELIAVINADNDLEKARQDYDKKIEAEEKRKEREKRIEVGKIFGINRTVDKVIKKSQSIFDSLIKFLAFTVLGQIVKFVTDFLRDPKNKEFIDNTINFIKSIPDRLREVRDKLIPVIDWFKEQGKKIGKFAEDFRKLLTKFPFLGQYFATKKEKEEGIPTVPGTTLEPGQFPVLPNVGPSGIPMIIPFATGGLAMGTDTVPAMLTPGEFVMSRGAVNMFGADTMMAMNKAGGGTNRPKFGLVPGYRGGGFVISREQQALLDAISFAEGTKKSYGTIYGGKIVPELEQGKLTLDQVHAMMMTGKLNGKSVGYGRGKYASSATGRYQLMPDTLRDIQRNMKLPGDTLLTPDMQDKMILDRVTHFRGVSPEMLRKEGLSTRVLDKLAPEFASFPYAPKGNQSYYGQPVKSPESIRQAYNKSLSRQKTAAPSSSLAPPVMPPPGLPGGTGKSDSSSESPVDTRFGGINLDFIFKPLRQFLGVDTPNAPTSTKIIVLPPIKQQAKQPTTTQTSNEIPDFRVSSGVQMRGLVGKALGIEDLVS